jgi:hypothetical protein
VVGHLVAWGRSAAGRLGVGDAEAYHSHLAHAAADVPTSTSTSTSISTLAAASAAGAAAVKAVANKGADSVAVGGGDQGEVAFYKSMSAVFFDDGCVH